MFRTVKNHHALMLLFIFSLKLVYKYMVNNVSSTAHHVETICIWLYLLNGKTACDGNHMMEFGQIP